MTITPEAKIDPTLRVAAFLIALSITAPLSIDVFLPSMPEIADEFGSSDGFITLGVTLFLVAFAGSQLFYGAASDRWGRRPILFAGLSVYVVGGVMCLTAASAEQLIIGRVLQGLGGGVGPAIANAMVLDLFSKDGATRMIGYQSIVFPLAPAVAPILGGAIAAAAGWRAVFVVLTAFGVGMAMWYSLTLGETRPPRTGPPRGLMADYRTLFTSPTFVGFALVLGLVFSGMLLFVSTSSFVLIDRLGLSPTMFGFAFGLMAIGLMGGAMTSNRLVKRLQGHDVVLAGASCAAAATAVLFLLVLAGVEHPLPVIGSTFFTAFGAGMSRPSAMAGALVPFPEIAGVASSTLIFTQMAISSGYNVVYSLVFEPGLTALATGMLVPIAMGLVVAAFVGSRARRAIEVPHGDASTG